MYEIIVSIEIEHLTFPVPILDKEKKLTQIFILTLPFLASKGFKDLHKLSS